MNLLEFLAHPKVKWNLWVDEPEFDSLYVRKGSYRLLNGMVCFDVFDIASVEAKEPGKGSFTRLLKKIQEHHPNLVIFVESVMNERFRGKLFQLGFEQVYTYNPPSYVLFSKGEEGKWKRNVGE